MSDLTPNRLKPNRKKFRKTTLELLLVGFGALCLGAFSVSILLSSLGVFSDKTASGPTTQKAPEAEQAYREFSHQVDPPPSKQADRLIDRLLNPRSASPREIQSIDPASSPVEPLTIGSIDPIQMDDLGTMTFNNASDRVRPIRPLSTRSINLPEHRPQTTNHRSSSSRSSSSVSSLSRLYTDATPAEGIKGVRPVIPNNAPTSRAHASSRPTPQPTHSPSHTILLRAIPISVDSSGATIRPIAPLSSSPIPQPEIRLNDQDPQKIRIGNQSEAETRHTTDLAASPPGNPSPTARVSPIAKTESTPSASASPIKATSHASSLPPATTTDVALPTREKQTALPRVTTSSTSYRRPTSRERTTDHNPYTSPESNPQHYIGPQPHTTSLPPPEVPATYRSTSAPPTTRATSPAPITPYSASSPAKRTEQPASVQSQTTQQSGQPRNCIPWLVQPGQTVESLAASVGISPQTILEANNTNTIAPGQMIKLPVNIIIPYYP